MTRRWAVGIGLLAGLLGCVPPHAVDRSLLDDWALPFQFDERARRSSRGVAVDLMVEADENGDGVDDRSLELTTDSDLVVQDHASGDLRRIPLDGGASSVVAAGAAPSSLVAGDARGIYWVTQDCALWAAPARRLGTCVGKPRFFLSDERDLYVFAATPSGGMQVWREPRAAGAPGNDAKRVADLGTLLNHRPDQRPLQNQSSFYFTDAHRRLLRLAKGTGGLSTVAAAPEDHGAIWLAGLDTSFVYWVLEGRLVRAPVNGGAPVTVSKAGEGSRVYALGGWLYLDDGVLYRAPLSGGTWHFVALTPSPSWALQERAGKVFALGSDCLMRIDPDAPPAHRLFNTEDLPLESDAHFEERWIESLAAQGDQLYFTLTTPAGAPELWAMPKAGGAPVVVLKGESIESAPVLDQQFAYFVSHGGGVRRAPLGAGPVETLVTSEAVSAALAPSTQPWQRPLTRGPLLPELMSLDDRFVYWRDARVRGALKARKQGGPPTLLTDDAKNAPQLAQLFEAQAAPIAPNIRLDLAPGAQVPGPVRARGSDLLFMSHGQIRSQSRVSGRLRVLSYALHAAVWLVDDDAVFFLEVGEPANPKSSFGRMDCCEIWAAPR